MSRIPPTPPDDAPRGRAGRQPPKFTFGVLSPYGGTKPIIPQTAVELWRHRMRRHLDNNPNGWEIKSIDTVHGDQLIMTWQRVGPDSGYMNWKWNGKLAAVAFVLGGGRGRDCYDAQVLFQGAHVDGITIDEKFVNPLRRARRPAIQVIILDPQAGSRTPIIPMSVGFGQSFFEAPAGPKSSPPLGDASHDPSPLLYELRINVGATIADEKWVATEGITLSIGLQTIYDTLKSRLAENAPQFTEFIRAGDEFQVRIEWRAMGTGAAFAEVQDSTQTQKQLVLYLSGIDRDDELAAVDAFIKTILVRLSPTSFELSNAVKKAPRPMLLNVSSSPIKQLDVVASTLAITYFRHLGVLPD